MGEELAGARERADPAGEAPVGVDVHSLELLEHR